ncbi:Response regulator receiver domain-containing protein [Duganella sp. CF402]|uniref:response regulator n=1 Tax=unclassified Duganella TaxID=2636909 RepID=UPI0008D558CE|nr:MULTISPECIES: response regulator [unclassified Duganella]RZT10981.1 response regulator receiver domain-containing protein [Duganella sp. BK701]SEK87055.1 Response regulator receiver domain-containing protein [Duganella sp. CF402]
MNAPSAVMPPAPDWSSTALGDPVHWPPTLRLTIDILLNSPQAMLLMWGSESVMVYNQAYADLVGLPSLRPPGGSVPSMQPAAWSWNHAAIAAAHDGRSQAYHGCRLPVWRNGRIEQQALDLYYTPVRDGDNVRGILCTLAATSIAPLEGNTAPLRLLVVEDNADARYLVCETLRALGHEVQAVASGEDALPQLAAQPFDVLFTDVSLPGMSGVDLARQALRQHPRMALLFASGYGDELTRRLEFPARSLQKPYDIEHLQTALDQIAAGLAAQ